MIVRIDRRWKKNTYTVGILSLDGVRFCETLEDRDRGLRKDMSDRVIAQVKVPGETAIPAGSYPLRLDIISPKYSAIGWYRSLCGGRMPRVIDVPGFSGVLIHPGNGPEDTRGCVLVGRNTVKGGLTKSRDTFAELYRRMAEAVGRGEPLTLEIV